MELAFILIPFFAILFAIVDYAQIYFYENSLQNALREACRFATAGSVISSGVTTNIDGVNYTVPINDSEGRPASRNTCIKYWFISNCIIQSLPLSNIYILSAPTLPDVPPVVSADGSTLEGGVSSVTTNSTVSTNNNVTTTNNTYITNYTSATAGPGGEGDYVQIYASYTVPTITPIFGIFDGLFTRNTISGSGYPCRVSAIVKNEPALLNFSTNFIHAVYSDEYNYCPGFPSTNQF